MAIDFQLLEAIIRQDPSGRGVSNYRHDGEWLAAGILGHAAYDLAERAEAVAIVTGFCVADVEPPAAETDGPPGALYLARALMTLGCDVVLVSDRYALPLFDLGCRHWQLAVERFEIPLGGARDEGWVDDFFRSPIGKRLTHLIAIERVGPSHTIESLSAQGRATPAPLDQFRAEVPAEHRDVCHNMRGIVIDAYTGPAHRLFEVAQSGNRAIKTIAIGDGGNEIGMGAIPWELLRGALKGEHADRIICRVATEFLILAGVSNWGAYALACAVANLRGRSDLLTEWNSEYQRELIELLARDGGAVDGLTRRPEPTVDGLSLDFYLDVLDQIRRSCE